ncbi:MAG: alpha/beta-hydrolase family protein [Ilumatobacteraceae bacterium]
MPRTGLLRRPNLGGLVVALLFWWWSLAPLLLPRGWQAQALVSGVCVAVGYLIGTVIGAVVHRILARLDRRPSDAARRGTWRAFGVLAIVLVVVGLIRWTPRQNDHRDLIGLAHISASAIVPMVIVTLIATALLAVIGRLVWAAVRWLQRVLARLLPGRVATAIAVVLALLIGNWALSSAGSRMHSWANTTWGALEDDTDPDVTQPSASEVSGSPDSLVPWTDLGLQGRRFVAGATTADELTQFNGARWDGTLPIRVYAGLRSGDTAAARADVAVRELERTGAFDRKALVVWTVTGTGWVDPDAARAFEQMYSGNSAIVSQQYSFLPSWMSTLVDGPVARDAGSALFDAVYRRWAELPESGRPKLYVFGLSLGSYGGEAAFTGTNATTSIANMVARTDGVMFVGPTNGNQLWNQLTDERDAGSPAWRPVVDGGETVYFANQLAELRDDPGAAWESPRVLYLQHPTDPVTFWNWQTMWSEPEWIQGELGRGVARDASWVPFVTWAQLVADLSAGFGADPGFGHDYTDAYVAAWAAIAPPDGWTAADTDRLEAFLGEISDR